jgi:hypothetical protein
MTLPNQALEPTETRVSVLDVAALISPVVSGLRGSVLRSASANVLRCLQLIGLVLFCAVDFANSLAAADFVLKERVIVTSLIRVLAHPEQYDGKRIMLLGHYVGDPRREHTALYLTRDDALHDNHANSVWIDLGDLSVDPKQRKPIKKGFVRVIGTFHHPAEGAGHFGLWPAELTHVILLERAR